MISRARDRLPVHPDGWLAPRSFLVLPRRWKSVKASFELPETPAGRPFTLRLTTAGRILNQLTANEPGRASICFDLPQSLEEPFVKVVVDSSFSFRPPGDARRLSVRCVGLEPVDGSRDEDTPVSAESLLSGEEG